MKLENYKIPDYSLSESIKFIEPIAFSGFSSINKFQYANLRGFNASGGAYNLRLSSARLWGLISDGNPFSMTALSDKIFSAKSEIIKFETLYNASKTFIVLNRLSRDLPISPTVNDLSRSITEKIKIKDIRKIKNLIMDIRFHKSNYISEDIEFIQSKDIKLEMSGVKLEVEESKESLLAAIKLLESRLDLFRV